MYFDDESFLDDYEIKELIKKFESHLENDQSYYFDADEFNIIMEYYIQQNNIDKANIVANFATSYHPNDPITSLIRAKQMLANSNAEEALKALKNPNINVDDPDYQLTLGNCYSELDESQKAILAYKKAVSLLNKDECDDIYDSIALEYQNLGKMDKALVYLKKSLKDCSNIDNKYFEISNCYFILNKAEDAITFFKEEIDKNPYNIAAWMALGNCYMRLDLLEKAIDKFEYALAIDQHYAKAYINIAIAYNELDRFQDTVDIVKEAFRNKVKKPLLYCLYGEALDKLGNKTEALSYYKKAITMDENIPEAYAGIGFILSEENNTKSAIKFLTHAYYLAPYNPDYIYALVDEYNKLGAYENSLKYLKKIEELSPYDENLYIAYMEVCLSQDDIKNAIKYINKGLGILEGNAALLYRLAFIQFTQKEDESALLNLEEALSINFEGYKEFLDFDFDYLTNNERIIELINKYRKKDCNKSN